MQGDKYKTMHTKEDLHKLSFKVMVECQEGMEKTQSTSLNDMVKKITRI